MYLVPPSIDFIEGEEIDFFYGETIAVSEPIAVTETIAVTESIAVTETIAETETIAVIETSAFTGRRKRSIINNCSTNCQNPGEWTSLDKNDGTGDHENFP